MGMLLLLLLAVAVAVLYQESKSSRWQARYFAARAAAFSASPHAGASPTIRFPTPGPYDVRLGYADLPGFIARLQQQGYALSAQARWSPALLAHAAAGFFTVYAEKGAAGLVVRDRTGALSFSARYPRRGFALYQDIPEVVVRTLLYIEDRALLDERYPYKNPALEWDRFGRALLDWVGKKLGLIDHAVGASTLATQIEKFRHSEQGYTRGVHDKYRQMMSASLRAYMDGPDTRARRRAIVRDYLNAVPLSAAVGYGEVNGLGDGLWAWYGRNLADVTRQLSAPGIQAPRAVDAAQGQAYRTVLSLLLAQRRPSYYLGAGHDDLQALADSYLRLMRRDGIIGDGLYQTARAARIERLPKAPARNSEPFAARKTDSIVRTRLAHTLGVPRLYDLDRLDLAVAGTLDQRAQQHITELRRSLGRLAGARAAGALGFRVLDEQDDLSKIVYSFTLYERTAQGNAERIQSDTFDQPLDINEGVKLDLGSTAKLRTVMHYMELIEGLYRHYSAVPEAERRRVTPDPRDRLSAFVLTALKAHPKLTLEGVLQAALQRRYSANPHERFFTAGGSHRFVNFNHSDDGRVLSVREALQDSVNLVFVRLMRDVVNHHIYKPGSVARALEDQANPLRRAYLMRFADREGRVYLRRFYGKYRGKDAAAILDTLVDTLRPTPARLALAYRYINPTGDRGALRDFLRTHIETTALTQGDVDALYGRYAPGRYDLPDMGYIARVHPLELWLAAYLSTRPGAGWEDVVAASAGERQDVYRWLFKTRRTNAQDLRIHTLLEIEAFLEIHKGWKHLGYPFDTLVPSYASAIGSSADRPAALAELMGILANNGVRLPTVRFTELRFAGGTPYETTLSLQPAAGVRVLSPEAAASVRAALLDVVEKGTARRLGHPFLRADGGVVTVAGKTGTGDHRRDIYGAGGRLIESRVVNRTATFAFILGERHFGTITVYMPGHQAARYKFTSSLPVQVLKAAAPYLQPLVMESILPAAAHAAPGAIR